MTRRRSTTGRVAAGLAALVLAGTAGCGGAESGESSAQPSEAPAANPSVAAAPAIDVSVVRRAAHYDYEPARSLTDLVSGRTLPLAEEEDLSVTLGEVVGWSDGRSLVESGSGFSDTFLFAVLQIKVIESYRSLGNQDGSGRIYVEVPRGGQVRIDGELPDDGGKPAFSSIDELNAAVPKGTRIIVVGAEAPTTQEWEAQAPDGTVHNAAAARPDGSPLLRAVNPQGLVFKDETGAFAGGLDDEEPWDWLPSDLHPHNGFEHLVSELDNLNSEPAARRTAPGTG